MNIGILGAGRIAHTLAKTMKEMPDVNLYAIASRDLENAKTYAAQYGIEKAYGSYEELVSDPKVELIYICTPHSHHFDHMKLCIEHGKPVLCEKAFTMNAAQAKEIIALAREKKVFLAEAIWTRYMPSREMINEIIASGIVGRISFATCNLSYAMADKPRIHDPHLCGGALLDIGIYGINFMDMHLGRDIDRIESSVLIKNGIDEAESMTIFYKDGTVGVSVHNIFGRSDRKGIFYGETGYIIVENINNPQCIDVFDDNDQLIKHIEVPAQITGYEYEVQECIDCIRAGKTESDSMPLDETIYLMERMDALRKEWNLIYPMEEYIEI